MKKLSAYLFFCLAFIVILSINGPEMVFASPQQQSDDSVSIDYSLGDFDENLQKGIDSFVADNIENLLTEERDFIITVQYDDEDGVQHIRMFPRHVYESQWTELVDDADIISLIAVRVGSDWVINFDPIYSNSVDREDRATTIENFSFPWTHGNTWLMSQTLHSGNIGQALDFVAGSGASLNVLAIEDGVFTPYCYNSDPYQVMVAITHSDGSRSAYLHLSKSSVPSSLFNDPIDKGTKIGSLYTGSAWAEPYGCRSDYPYKYNTPCGCGTGTHLHFETSSTSMNFQGLTISQISSTGVRKENFIADYNSPSTSRILNGTLGENGWYITNVTVNLSAIDSGVAGVKRINYKIDGGSWIQDSGASASITISQSGSHTVYYQAVDYAGNWESQKSVTFKIDNILPTTPSLTSSGCSSEDGVWQNICNDPNFIWSTSNDATSGIAGYQYYWGTSPTGTNTFIITDTFYNPEVVGEGVYYFRVRSKDNAGNYSFWKTLFILKYDATSPAGVLQINEGQNETYRTLVTLNPSGSDSLSGARWVRFRDQGNTWTEWQQIIDTYWVLPAVTGHKYIVEAEIMDAAGNISSLISDDIYLNIYPNRPSSTNYTLQKSTFGMSATNASSSQYQLSGTLSQPSTIGSHETDNYKLSSGFWSWLVNLVTGPEADLSINKSASVGSVYTGQSVTYTLEVQNLGPDEAEDITVVDTLPAGAVFNSAAGTGWSCGEVGGEVQCTRTSMDAAASSTITITINAPGNASTMTNHVEISSSTEDSSLLNNSSNAIVEVRNYADLAITKTASIESIEMGGQFSYSIDVQNLGPGTANGLRVVDNLPAGVSFVSASGTGWVCQNDSGVVTCDLVSLHAGATTTIIIEVTAPTTAGRFTNLVSVSSATLDQDMANNDASEEVLVLTEADLEILKTTQVSFVKPGYPITYTITVQNLGEVEATGITVVDELQDGVVLVSITGETGWECVEATRTCVLASLGGGASSSITLTVTSPETEGVIDNLAQVTSELVEENIENNSDTCSVTVRDETAPEHHNFIPIFIH